MSIPLTVDASSQREEVFIKTVAHPNMVVGSFLTSGNAEVELYGWIWKLLVREGLIEE